MLLNRPDTSRTRSSLSRPPLLIRKETKSLLSPIMMMESELELLLRNWASSDPLSRRMEESVLLVTLLRYLMGAELLSLPEGPTLLSITYLL